MLTLDESFPINEIGGLSSRVVDTLKGIGIIPGVYIIAGLKQPQRKITVPRNLIQMIMT